MYERKILIRLDIDKVNRLCAICDSMDIDVNVMYGRQCVDGKSIMGVAQFCGKTVELIPITDDDKLYEEFHSRVREINGY